MLGKIFNGGWQGGARWVGLLVFGGLLGFAVWNDVSDGGFNAVQAIEAKKLQKTYEDVMLTAQSAVRKAHAESLKSCSEMTQTCRAGAEEAARKAGLAALRSGGCIDWEMSEWSPTRASPDAAKAKSRTEAETACALAAEELARRMSAFARKQN